MKTGVYSSTNYFSKVTRGWGGVEERENHAKRTGDEGEWEQCVNGFTIAFYNVDKKFSLSVTFLLPMKHSWFVVFVCMVLCLR